MRASKPDRPVLSKPPAGGISPRDLHFGDEPSFLHQAPEPELQRARRNLAPESLLDLGPARAFGMFLDRARMAAVSLSGMRFGTGWSLDVARNGFRAI
jgi:hypothetical protein